MIKNVSKKRLASGLAGAIATSSLLLVGGVSSASAASDTPDSFSEDADYQHYTKNFSCGGDDFVTHVVVEKGNDSRELQDVFVLTEDGYLAEVPVWATYVSDQVRSAEQSAADEALVSFDGLAIPQNAGRMYTTIKPASGPSCEAVLSMGKNSR